MAFYNKESDARCRICGSSSFRTYLVFRGREKEIVVCLGCGTLRTRPYFLTDYSKQEIYCGHYVKNERLYRGFARKLVDLVMRHKKSGRLLDVGCSVGFLVEEALRSGFDAEGVELNEEALKICASKGLRVTREDPCEASRPGNYFDVVTLNHVLEHVSEPGRFLEGMNRILKKEGIVAIGVPNHDSLAARLFRENWYGWGMTEHLWHFDKKSIRFLLEKNNFRVLNIIQDSQHYPVSKSFRKNSMAILAAIGAGLGMGDQIIALAEKI